MKLQAKAFSRSVQIVLAEVHLFMRSLHAVPHVVLFDQAFISDEVGAGSEVAGASVISLLCIGFSLAKITGVITGVFLAETNIVHAFDLTKERSCNSLRKLNRNSVADHLICKRCLCRKLERIRKTLNSRKHSRRCTKHSAVRHKNTSFRIRRNDRR